MFRGIKGVIWLLIWTVMTSIALMVYNMLSGDSAFLNVNQRSWIYGYRDDPRRIPANRARFRAMVGMPADPESTALLSGERQVAPALNGIQQDHLERYRWAAAQASGTVLDIGAGIGYGSAILADTPGVDQVISIERSRESIEYAQAHYDRVTISRHELDLDGYELDDSPRADSATAFEIIEHLARPEPMLKSLPAERLFASVPNEAVVPYSPDTAPFHQRHYTKEQFDALLQAAGWEVVGWYGQRDRESPVQPLTPEDRTLIVEARRCPSPAS